MTNIKITSVGDIMCHIQQNNACKTVNSYDYSKVFKYTKKKRKRQSHRQVITFHPKPALTAHLLNAGRSTF